VVVSGVLRDRFFVELDRVGSVTVAARAVGVNRNTAFGWARAAGRRSVGPGGRRPHPGRGEYERLRAAGVLRREAAAQVGVNERTARDWDRGVRKSSGRRLYPDGRLVDYARGVTTIVDVDAPTPRASRVERVLDARFVSLFEREQIADLHRTGCSVRAIARVLGRAPSTVSRELRRNGDARGAYRPFAAHRASTACRSPTRQSRTTGTGSPCRWAWNGNRVWMSGSSW